MRAAKRSVHAVVSAAGTTVGEFFHRRKVVRFRQGFSGIIFLNESVCPVCFGGLNGRSAFEIPPMDLAELVKVYEFRLPAVVADELVKGKAAAFEHVKLMSALTADGVVGFPHAV